MHVGIHDFKTGFHKAPFRIFDLKALLSSRPVNLERAATWPGAGEGKGPGLRTA
jgi:hypothetical protein